MANHYPRASTVPHSSVVGSSVLIHKPTGEVEAQLAILGVDGTGDAWKAAQQAIAFEVTKSVNLLEHMVHVLEVIRDNEQDRVRDGDQETMSPIVLNRINRLLDEAKAVHK